jgi:hypothetical protein
MTHTAGERTEKTREQTAATGLITALKCEHPNERTADPVRWAPRIVVYPREIYEFMEAVKTGRHQTLSVEGETIGAEIAILFGGWGRSAGFKVIRHEEAGQEEPQVDSWMHLAQNAALGAHPWSNAEEGGEVLQGV